MARFLHRLGYSIAHHKVAVLFGWLVLVGAGLLVGLSLIGLLGHVVGVPTIAPVAAAITLLPAVLALVGTKIDSARMPAYPAPEAEGGRQGRLERPAVLFGLSMDHQVFLMSQIEHARARTDNDHDAITLAATTVLTFSPAMLVLAGEEAGEALQGRQPGALSRVKPRPGGVPGRRPRRRFPV